MAKLTPVQGNPFEQPDAATSQGSASPHLVPVEGNPFAPQQLPAPPQQTAVAPTSVAARQEQGGQRLPGVVAAPLEAMAGFNRAATGLVDFLGPDQVNAVLQLAGSDYRVPTLTEALAPATQGGYMEPGLGRDIAAAAGEVAAAGLGAGTALRQAASRLPAATGGESVTRGALRQAAATTPAQDLALGAASGVGTEVGREFGGEPGALAGSILAPVTIAAAPAAVRASASAARGVMQPAPQLNAAQDIVGDVARKFSDPSVQRFQSAYQRPLMKFDETPPEAKSYEEIADLMRKGNVKGLAKEVLPDPVIMDAAEKLGVDLDPSHYSTSRAFIEARQALKSQPGSRVGATEERAIRKLGETADNLIMEMGGSPDRSLVDARISNQLGQTITAMESKASQLYSTVNGRIPKSVKVNPAQSRNYLSRVLNELGDNQSLLSEPERKLLKIIQQEDNPTYAALDRLRKEVGRGFNKQGEFADADESILRQVYASLSEDQQGIADAYGVGAQYAAGRKLVAERKAIESQAMELFGRDLSKSLVPKMKTAINALTAGDMSKFEKLVNALPKNRRQEAVATMLGDIFSAGARSRQGFGQGFVNAFNALNRNRTAKTAIFRYLPKEAEHRFNMLGRVATGLYRAKALENTSRTARDIIHALNNGSLFGKMYDVGKRAAIAEGATTSVGIPGIGSALVVGSAIAKGKTPAIQAADELISSPAFRTAVEEFARGNKEAAEKIIQSSTKYKNWIQRLDEAALNEVNAKGFIGWLATRDNDEGG